MACHRGWERCAAPPAGPYNTTRCTLVYLPPDYEPEGPDRYPVLYALHGFGDRPNAWIRTLLPVLERSMEDGRMPSVIVVMPDFSISGNGLARGSWPGDGRAGSWCINSNAGAFGDYFTDVLRPWVSRNYRIRSDPAGTALLGLSMGGFGALYHSLTGQGFASTIAAVSPKSDLRYSVSGSRLAAYDPAGYEPIEQDEPRRAMMGLDALGLLGVAEEFFISQVFGAEGPLWPKDMPVWNRMQSVNPVDILKADGPDLSSLSYYITAGDRDEFNFHSQLPLIVPELERHGADVVSRILSGLHHGWWEWRHEAERREVVDWIGARLREKMN